MSYPPQRPPSTPISNESNTGGANASSSQHSMNGSGQSPLDWANFMSFPTPPVNGPVVSNGNGMRSSGGSIGYSNGNANGNGQKQTGNGHQAHGQDEYQAFAQGIAASRPSPASLNFQHPYQNQNQTPNQNTAALPSSRSSQSYVTQPSPLQNQLQLPQITPGGGAGAGPSRSPRASVEEKGKSSVHRSTSQSGPSPQQQSEHLPHTQQHQHQQQQHQQNSDNGLTLDPDAFSRELRFQVPPFLSNAVGGAPTFPPGGEAWSGFGAASMFGGDITANQLTPGSMFGVFGMAGSGQNDCHPYGASGNEQSGGGRNVLEGLSGFMGDNGWESWDHKESGGATATGLTPNPLGTTFYVNPNPSPNILAGKTHTQQQQNTQNKRPNVTPISVNNNPPIRHVSQSPRSAHPTVPSPRISTNQVPQVNPSRRGTMPSPHSSTSGTMPTSAIFATPTSLQQAQNFYVSSLSEPTAGNRSASTINIASSSSQPYAPPTNTQALLSGPTMPSSVVGPNLADGPGLYSTTGFDMVGVLSRVASRKDPKTVLGPVDLSCSFLVVDIRRYDSPIVYASPTFTALTGYDLPQILGRNCRFLQAPDGEVVKGSKRKYTDNVAVAHLKRMLNAGKECQASLINYRRGGIPFINLVTVVPIPWEGTDIVYHVGFQVDLVEQPNAILRNMRDGSYQVNYTVANPPQPPLRPPGRESGLGLNPEVLEIMGPKVNAPGFGQGEEGGKTEWLKMVLENADDFVHVLSLKGLFQYVSPSVRRVLEYEPEDLINKNISDICHPSDIVPLMRELKDSTHAPVDGNSARRVHLVFRIRRKSSGYVWIDCTGRLHVEPGKGRKAVILSGRAISVPTLPWSTVGRHGGLADTEAWMKISFDGLILHSTTTVSDLTGHAVEDVVGANIFALLPDLEADSTQHAAALHSAIRSAAIGDARNGGNTVRHKLAKKSGGYTDVVSIIYPPKSTESNNLRSDDDESHDQSPVSEDSHANSSSSSSISGIKPSSLIIQIKLAVNANSQGGRAIVHPPSANVFEELETTRGTSWQYELHQLRLLNRRLKEDISSARARGAKGFKGKKRKANTGDDRDQHMGPPPPPSSTNTSNSSSSVSDQYAAAPRHQLAPGFGLVAPGMPSPYYQ